MRVALVVAPAEAEGGPMSSRVPTFLHPVAGRPLLWHAIVAAASVREAPERVLVLMPAEYAGSLPDDLPPNVRAVPLEGPATAAHPELRELPPRVLVVRASAWVDLASLQELDRLGVDAWMGSGEDDRVAVAAGQREALEIIAAEDLAAAGGAGAEWVRVGGSEAGFGVRTRADLARMQALVRDRLLQSLMEGGVTFLLPETVLVDVDVRIGRDTVVYPGVVLEGQTTIGEETVVGPGCRVIDSWIGSGVELKGWNYIAHTSVRNRAILEPYVRRGFE